MQIVNNGRKAKEKNLVCLKMRGFCLKKVHCFLFELQKISFLIYISHKHISQ